MKLPVKIVSPLLISLYRFWCSTLRICESGRKAVDELEAAGRPMMFSLWHDELFALMHVRESLRIVTVVSQSRDGEYLARLLQGLGLKTVRGSSTRGGIGALLRAARFMRTERYNGCITVDGPRGPRHVVKQGAIVLAFRVPAHIVPVRIFYERAKVFSSWDRFQLPLPFSRVHIVFGAPYLPDATDLTKSELERERFTLENALHALRPSSPGMNRGEKE
jgi:lysophospholipid acyltransferase (LPLAT)-like uncharacterized protein